MSFNSFTVVKTVFFGTVLLIFIFIYVLFKSISVEENMIFEVHKGYGLNQVIDHLYEQKVIKRPLLFKLYGKVSKESKNIQAGEYQILKNDNPLSLIKKISNGSIYYRQIRLKEGSTFNELLRVLKNNPYISKEPPIKDLSVIYSHLKLNLGSLEGLFFPDTYNYKKGDSYLDILERAYLKQQLILNEIWALRNLGLPYKNAYEALILASIIEKEGLEKKEIAGVFVRRLQSKMKLQSDPTIIYALGDKFDGDIKRSHIKMKHPYNTYYIEGLPPSPIGLVSKTSIDAALHPSEGSSLYFVSKGDGTHFFSDNLEEHIKAVAKFQLN
mgnify:CR=1 FL=1